MKEFLGWLAWVWRNWETWQRLWVVGAGFAGAGLTASDAARPYLLAVPITIFFVYTFKWAVWDGVRDSWTKYKAHRNQLLTTIKNSEGQQGGTA